MAFVHIMSGKHLDHKDVYAINYVSQFFRYNANNSHENISFILKYITLFSRSSSKLQFLFLVYLAMLQASA
jgi:hypothetical protein